MASTPPPDERGARIIVAYELDGGGLILARPGTFDSCIYFCRSCGEIWARCLAGPEWQVEQSPCAACAPSGVADWSKLPGSLINGLISRDYLGTFRWSSAIESLPPALLERELMLHLDYYEKRLLNDEHRNA